MAAFSVDDQPLLDLVHNIFTGNSAATFSDCDHLHPKMHCNILATPLSDHLLMEFTPHEHNALDSCAQVTDNCSALAWPPTTSGPDVWPISPATNMANVLFKDQNSCIRSSLELSSHEHTLSKDAKFVVEPNNTHCLMDSKPPKLETLNSALDKWIKEMECKGQFHKSNCVDKISNSSHKPCGYSNCTPYPVIGTEDASHLRMTKRKYDIDFVDQNSGREEEPLKGLKEIKSKRSRTGSSCKEPKIRGNGESKLLAGIVKAESPKNYIHVRARRGEATDSHSLAERARRQKIRERMKKLQELVPGCNKVTGKAQMLDEIINYVQSLQGQVELLSVKLAFVVRLLNLHIHI